MNRKSMTIATLGALSALFTLVARPAQADLNFTLTPDTLIGRPGDTIHFFGTLENTDPNAPLYLNGDNYPALDSNLSLDDTPFLLSVPDPLAPAGDASGMDKYTGELFDVTIGQNAITGNFQYDFSFLGGADGLAQTSLATASFQVTVVPEPSACAMSLVLAVGGLSLLYRRRKVSA